VRLRAAFAAALGVAAPGLAAPARATAQGADIAAASRATVQGAEAEDSAEAHVGVMSPEMRAVDVDERRGQGLDLGLRFTDHMGREVTLGDFFADGERPVLLTLNYYRCKVICNVQLDGLAKALRSLDWMPGRNFRVVAVSIDPTESAEDAARKRAAQLLTVDKGDDLDWTFLVGAPASIRALSAQLGVSYAYDREQDQYAHPAVAMFIAPDGRVMQYLYGLTYDPKDLKFALIEASEGKVGSPMEKLLMSCFHYDASIGRYGPFAMGIMRLGGGLTLLFLAAFLGFWWRRERRLFARTSSPSVTPTEAVT
jgi:protein SCO1/2